VNKILVAFAAAIVLVGTAVAADAPATLTFDTKNGKVAFNHKGHADKLAGDCKKCHADAKGGKIAGWSKDSAHALCQGCHKAEKKGPTKCAECHQKK
jgi:predicted CXXCH cytochrome family protein